MISHRLSRFQMHEYISTYIDRCTAMDNEKGINNFYIKPKSRIFKGLYTPYGDYILAYARLHTKPFGLDKKDSPQTVFFCRGRRIRSRLPARSVLLLRRGLHRRPAPLGTWFWSKSEVPNTPCRLA